MILTDEQMAMLKDMAGHFMTPFDIAIILKVPVDDLRACLSDPSDPVYQAYHEAKILTSLELRRKIIGMAKKGSPQAETLANQFMQDQILGED